jgi:protein-L-isoaspartate(D-aspartate) O-methyltransferase
MKALLHVAITALLGLSVAAPLRCFGSQEGMIQSQIVSRDITDPAVIAAFRQVRREEFVPKELKTRAFQDSPLPIGNGQTISQPYVVGVMTELLQVKRGMKVLEIGTGSGYQAAILHVLTPNVFTIEIVEPLYRKAKPKLLERGFRPEQVVLGDGYRGLPKEAPFDRIIVTAAPQKIPQALIDQLAPGGRMVIPVGPEHHLQSLEVLTKSKTGKVSVRHSRLVRFVPMTGGKK